MIMTRPAKLTRALNDRLTQMRVTSSGARGRTLAFFVVVCAACSAESLLSTTRTMNPLHPPKPPPPPGVSVREAVAEEAYSLTNMINEAFKPYRETFLEEYSTRVTPDGKQVATMMQQPCNAFLVAEEINSDASKSVVGCVHVCWSGETDSKDADVDAHFGMLSVVKRCSGRGIGKLLVSAAEERCRKELHRKDIVMEISILSMCPRLIGWYESQGYRRKGSIPYPAPQMCREGFEFTLELMTKVI